MIWLQTATPTTKLTHPIRLAPSLLGAASHASLLPPRSPVVRRNEIHPHRSSLGQLGQPRLHREERDERLRFFRALPKGHV